MNTVAAMVNSRIRELSDAVSVLKHTVENLIDNHGDAILRVISSK